MSSTAAAAAAAASGSDDALSVFLRLGLDSRTAESAAKAAKVGPALLALAREAGVAEAGCDRAVGGLLLQAATKLAPAGLHYSHRSDLLRLIVDRRVRSVAAVDAACDYLRRGSAAAAGQPYDRAEMEAVAGVGVQYSDAQLQAAIDAVLDSNSAALQADRYRAASRLLGAVTASLPWSDGRTVKGLFDSAVASRIGPKTDEDSAPPLSKKKQQPHANGAVSAASGSGSDSQSAGAAARASSSSATGSSSSSSSSPSAPAAPSAVVSLSSPSPSFLSLPAMSDGSALSSFLDNIDGREIVAARNTAEQLRRHEAVVPRGQVRTRFPPEPNGYLHLGHAKAMNFNFGLARLTNGMCLMRFDDTNPEAEKLDYIEQILNNLQWLGHQPARVTYSSDYFPQLYDLAVKLIRSGHAYVDHQTAAEIKASRDYKEGSKTASPWRDRPVDESLRLFDDMRKGKFEEGAATLRMKGDLSHPNPQMWDLVAYRIKYAAHPHVGDRWCIYPTYDYTHCLEDITHSCCTLEFEVRRESYYWILDVLDLYKPKVWEYSRLNVEYNVMSKRRLLRLVEEGHVRGWDDPRLLTLTGLRRRGYTPEAIRDFCNAIGISRNETMIPQATLEYWLRNDLETKARRAMCVVDPVKVLLTNYPAERAEQLTAPDFPKAPHLGSHSVPFSRVLYIDRDDVRLQDDKSFFGLAVGKEAHLKYAYNIRCDRIDVAADDPQRITAVHCTVDLTNSTKCKGKLHWVAEPQPGQAPLAVTLRLYDSLFCSKVAAQLTQPGTANNWRRQDPMAIEDWLTDLNAASLTTVSNALADPSVLSAPAGTLFQFERVAYFVVDPDSDASKQQVVLNRTVNLKESKPKADKPTPSAAGKGK